ncbi:hypothetical protein O3P69_002897 [Scylla paramamosain]|uniref:Uncharacterized protein n=1 Tax=Scylla paramamosain TaxID=85552 RepID=A0AAW0UQG9_SCYPA
MVTVLVLLLLAGTTWKDGVLAQTPIAGVAGRAAGVGEASTTKPKGDQAKVIVLQESGKPSAESYARLLTPFPILRTFTVCYRIRLIRFREESTLMSYAVSDDKDNELRMDHRITGYKVSLHSKWAQTSLDTPLRVWSHFCFQYQEDNGVWEIFMDGQQRANGSFPPFDEPLLGNGAYIIGQEQDSFGGNFQQDQSYSGEIAHLSFWDSYLSQDEIIRIAECQEPKEQPLLGWSSQEWELQGEVYSQFRPLEDICSSHTRTFKMFLKRQTLQRSLHFCRVVGGILAVPKTAEENALVYEASRDQAHYCSGKVGVSYLWLGANDESEERTWMYWESERPLTWENTWRGTGPNGGAVENCLVMLYGAYPGYWSDIACLDSYSFCVPCEFEVLPVMYLKGPALCESSPFDQMYLLGEAYDGQPSLKGFFHTDIYWNSTMDVWILQSLKVAAWAMWDPRRGVHYPFGTHQWKVMSVLCGLEAGMAVNLTLSVCGKGMFTCEDGTCISLQKRCDLRVDCPDQSDEHQCSLVDVPQDYQNNIPPQPTVLNQSLAIHFTINIISFPSVATQDLTFVTTFQLLLRWRDPRLSYLNLKTDRTLNMLSEDNKRRIWTPRVFFSNAHGNVFTNLNQGSRVECVQEGSSTVGGPHHTREVNIFSGSENSLEMGQLYSVTYSCDFELLMFPFDAQVCTMKFMLVSASASYMTLVPTLANYTGKTSLIEYAIGHLTMNTLPNEEFSSVAVEVRFMRRYGFYLLTLYIPTTLLMLIAYATLYFNPDDFNSRIVVALTSLLVLSSLFTQTSNSLPKTSYFKLVDVWLFFSIVMIFNVVMLQTLVDFSQQAVLNKGSRLARAFKKIHKFLRKLGNNKDVGQGTPVQDLRASGVIITHTKTAEEAEQEEPWAANGNNWHREEPSRLPIYGRAFRRKNWSENKDVNMSLMTFSRIILPVIFCIFNACYWGAAIV